MCKLKNISTDKMTISIDFTSSIWDITCDDAEYVVPSMILSQKEKGLDARNTIHINGTHKAEETVDIRFASNLKMNNINKLVKKNAIYGIIMKLFPLIRELGCVHPRLL
jgi:hypothetical protein